MKFDGELAKLAELLRIGAETARAIADARVSDGAVILRLADQADDMATELDDVLGRVDPDASHAGTLRLRRER